MKTNCSLFIRQVFGVFASISARQKQSESDRTAIDLEEGSDLQTKKKRRKKETDRVAYCCFIFHLLYIEQTCLVSIIIDCATVRVFPPETFFSLRVTFVFARAVKNSPSIKHSGARVELLTTLTSLFLAGQ